MRKNFYPDLLFICRGCLVLLSGCGAKRATAGYGGSEPHYYFLGEYDGKLLCGERDIENDDSPLFCGTWKPTRRPSLRVSGGMKS